VKLLHGCSICLVTTIVATAAAADMAGTAAAQGKESQLPLPLLLESPVPPPLPETMLSPFRPLAAPLDETKIPAGSVQHGNMRWLLFKDRAGRLYRTEVTGQ